MTAPEKAACPVPSGEDDLDAFVYELGDLARERLGGVFPEGFTLRQQRNGVWVGKWSRGEYKARDRRWVESLLFMCAADPRTRRDVTETP